MSASIPMPPYPWQQSLWQDFSAWVERDRLAHALLIEGPEGLGGTQLARAMAHYLLCDAPMGALACGKCRGCQLTAAESHPDLLRIAPEAPSTAIKIDQVRQVTDFVSKTAQQGGRKVLILSPAERMNHNAANALLKSLEEPAGRTHLLLVTHEPSRLLATIRSRCAKLHLALPQVTEAVQWLERAGVPDAERLLQRAGGEPLKAERWFAQDFAGQQQRMSNDLQDLTAAKRSPLEVARAWLEYGGVDVVDTLIVWVQTAIRQRHQKEQATGEKELAALAQAPMPLLFRYLDKLLLSKKELLSQNNPNLELLLDELLMGWTALSRSR